MKGLTIGRGSPFTTKKYDQLLTGEKPFSVEGLIEEDLGESALTVKMLEIVGRLVPKGK